MSAADGGHLVVFDLGGVLVRICRDWHEGCAVAGVKPRRVLESSDSARMRELVSGHQRGRIAHEVFCAGMSECLGGSLDAGEIAAVHDAWILGEYDGVSDLLAHLVAAGHGTGCLSNTNAPHWGALERMRFFGHLHHAHASHLLGMEKPDPEIFRAFERATGFAGRRIAYFDDLPENCRAAEASGWRVRQVDPGRETVPQIRESLRSWGLLP